MKILRNSLIVLIITSLAGLSFAQNPSDPKKPDDTVKLREKAVDFLRETSLEVGRMRSIENRISFGAELASLMWFHSEKEARTMFAGTIGDFKELILQLDARLNAAETPDDDEAGPGGFLFGMGGRSPAERKLRIAMAVRQQIALSLAEHDPEMAISFYFDSGSLVTNAEFRKQTGQSDKYFEVQLLNEIAATNAAKAVKYATDSIKDGIEGTHIELLKKIYAKDADKGAEFGAAILSRIKSDKDAIKAAYIYNLLLIYASESLDASLKPGGKKPIYSRSDINDLADRFGQYLLDEKNDGAGNQAIIFVDQIGKYAPGRAAQIRSKFAANHTSIGMPGSNNSSFGYGRAAANGMANAANAMSNANVAGDGDPDPKQTAEKQLMDSVKSVNKALPKEEREKIVAKTRKIIAATPGTEKKITALCMLAVQVAKAGDKELADEIMLDAERLIDPQPKNYRDYLYTWLVASGFAEANPDKAFSLLSATILRANDTLTAFVKVAEFIDVNEEMIDDGEVQVGMFGGSSLRGVTQELGIANTTLISLAKADFAKTKALTNDFDRIEIRVLSKMLILRAVLDDKKPKPGDSDPLLPFDADH